MPVMNGIEATRQIRTRTDLAVMPDVPVIAITAFTVDGDKERFLKAGMTDYVSKPLQAESLLEVLHRVLEGKNFFGHDKVELDVSRNFVALPNMDRSTDLVGSAMVVLDREKAMSAMAGNENLFALLCSSFLQEAEEKQTDLERAVAAQNWQSAMVAAHALKNSAGLLCAMALEEVAAEIETVCRDILEAQSVVPALNETEQLCAISAEQTTALVSQVSKLSGVMKHTCSEVSAVVKESNCG